MILNSIYSYKTIQYYFDGIWIEKSLENCAHIEKNVKKSLPLIFGSLNFE